MKPRSIFAVSIAFAICFLFCPQPASAQSTASAPAFNHHVTPAAEEHEASQMVPAEAILAQSIDARKMQSGQQFKAKLTDTVHLKNGIDLPKGTALLGTVATDRMRTDGTSTLALRFTKAELKDGKTIAIEATVIGIAPPEYGTSWDGGSGQAAPTVWNGKTLQVDEIGALSGTDLHSAIAAHDSALFVSHKKDNMKLSDQTQLSLAIAPRGSSGMNSGA